MPNDDQTDTIKTQTTTAPPIFVDSGDAPPMLNTKPNADIIDPSPATTSSVTPTNDIITPIMPAIVTSGPPKKKYAGGKIIATILGLFLLVGGVGAGVYLTGQNQNINEKAEYIRDEIKCPDLRDGVGYRWCIKNLDDGDLTAPVECNSAEWDINADGCVPASENGGGGGGGRLSCPPNTVSNGTCEACTCEGCSFRTETIWRDGEDVEVRRCNRPSYDNVPICCTPNTTPTPLPTRSATPTPLPTRSATPTPLPTRSETAPPIVLTCNNNCDLYNGPANQCGQGLLCLNVGTGAPQSKCRNSQCRSETDCTCASTGNISCIDLTSSVANPTVGQSVTGTCYGRFSSSVTSPVAQFGVSLNGTLLGVSGAIPLVAGEARYTTTVPQEGNYLVQCQICTDSTLSNCTTMGQAN